MRKLERSACEPFISVSKFWKVERFCGLFEDPEILAFRGQGPKQPLYRVRFNQLSLWPHYQVYLYAQNLVNTMKGGVSDTIDVEIYQSWLEPFDVVL